MRHHRDCSRSYANLRQTHRSQCVNLGLRIVVLRIYVCLLGWLRPPDPRRRAALFILLQILETNRQSGTARGAPRPVCSRPPHVRRPTTPPKKKTLKSPLLLSFLAQLDRRPVIGIPANATALTSIRIYRQSARLHALPLVTIRSKAPTQTRPPSLCPATPRRTRILVLSPFSLACPSDQGQIST